MIKGAFWWSQFVGVVFQVPHSQLVSYIIGGILLLSWSCLCPVYAASFVLLPFTPVLYVQLSFLSFVLFLLTFSGKLRRTECLWRQPTEGEKPGQTASLPSLWGKKYFRLEEDHTILGTSIVNFHSKAHHTSSVTPLILFGIFVFCSVILETLLVAAMRFAQRNKYQEFIPLFNPQAAGAYFTHLPVGRGFSAIP